jgi:hypothetical protein
MSARKIVLAAAILLIWAAPQARADGSVTGTIKDGTRGTPAASVQVELIDLQGGMDTVATTRTDAQGRFHFENPGLGRRPMLLRAVYRGVNFHEPVPPGTATVSVEVYDPSKDPKTISIPSLAVVFQPSDTSLLVGEEYTVENDSKPPVAYFREGDDFEFELPEKAELGETAAWGPSGMPVNQATTDRGGNRYALSYVFRPGENGVRLSYRMPYAASGTTIRLESLYAHDRVFLVAPPNVQLLSVGFRQSGVEQGMNVYMREGVAARTPVEVNLSGTGPQQASNPPGNDSARSSSGANDAGAAAQVMPERLDTLKWPLVGGFMALFALGAFFLGRRPVTAGLQGSSAGVSSRAMATAKSVAMAEGPSVDPVKEEVGANLDTLKDTLFRLELRHQAGTISDEEYARERSRLDKQIRSFIKG